MHLVHPHVFFLTAYPYGTSADVVFFRKLEVGQFRHHSHVLPSYDPDVQVEESVVRRDAQ